MDENGLLAADFSLTPPHPTTLHSPPHHQLRTAFLPSVNSTTLLHNTSPHHNTKKNSLHHTKLQYLTTPNPTDHTTSIPHTRPPQYRPPNAVLRRVATTTLIPAKSNLICVNCHFSISLFPIDSFANGLEYERGGAGGWIWVLIPRTHNPIPLLCL